PRLPHRLLLPLPNPRRLLPLSHPRRLPPIHLQPSEHGWSSCPSLDLQPALMPDDVDANTDDDDDLAVTELLDAAMEGDLYCVKRTDIDEAVAAVAIGVTGIKRRGPLHLAGSSHRGADWCDSEVAPRDLMANASSLQVSMNGSFLDYLR
ncbi:unnamed protein product, partial [Urochloa humidicola]